MSWESNPAEEQPEPVKDRTKLVWTLVLIGVVIMAVLLVLTTRQGTVSQSRAYVKHIYIPFEYNDPADRDRALQLVVDVRARILQGELTFEEAAKLYSSETTAERGGHLGWTVENDFAEGKAREFVWTGPVGELSNILESAQGFHLIYVEKRELSARDQYEREIQQRVLEGSGEASPN